MPTQSRYIPVLLLALCQALAMSCLILMVATSPLVGKMLSPDPALATLPFSFQLIATTLATIPLSMLMKKYGRRAGFMLGGAAGALGATLAAVSILYGSFIGFILGTSILGVFAASSLFLRFAAAEISDDDFRSKATSLVMAGGVLAAIMGPQIAKLSRDLLPVPFAGAYVAMIALPLLVILLQVFVRLPRPSEEAQAKAPESIGQILRRAPVAVAVLSAATAYVGMNFVMTATPLAMEHHGFAFDHSASVIQMHVMAMFLPSFFTGFIVARLGLMRVMISGAALMLACVAVAVYGLSFVNFAAALVLLGIGWNFLYIGATLLLTQSLAPNERAKTQGVNEFIVFGSTALGSFAAGATQAGFGWTAVNLAVVPLLVVTLAALVALAARQRKAAPQAA